MKRLGWGAKRPAPHLRRALTLGLALGLASTGIALVPTSASAAPALSVDRQVVTHQSTPSTNISSPAMTTTQPGDLILAFLASDGGNGAQSFSSVTGGGLTWSLRQRSNAQRGTSEIWQAVAPSTVSNLVVTATRSSGSYVGSMVVTAFAGADTATNGASIAGSGRSGAPTAQLTPTKAGSWVWAVGNDWDRAVARTVGANQTKVDEYLPTVGDTFWVQRQSTANTGAALSPVTINDVAPTNDQWNLALIEVRAADGGAIPPADTIAPTVAVTAPAAGATVSGTVTLSASATDNVGVSSVQFQVDGTDMGAADTAAPYATTWNTTAVANGSHSVRAVARDAAGNATTSSAVTVTVANSTGSGTFTPGNPSGTATVPAGAGLENVSSPDRVVGTGTAASCTSAAVVAAVAAGGVITFNCGAAPVTITLTQTLKVLNSTQRLVIDGGGKVTLSGGNANRILYVDTCDTSLGKVSGNCLYAPTYPQVTVQNLTFADGNATNSSYVSPGDTNQGSNGGGAIFALGGRLKVVNSVFVRNTCASNGPDLGGAAVRVLAQHSATPNDLDNSYAARNQDPVYIVNSTFGGASGQGNSCSNGGAISGLRTPITVLNSLISYNNAIGCCANPAWSGTPGGGSGGAIYTDGTSYDLRIAGSLIEKNTAKAGGSSIFYVSNDRTGRLFIDASISRLNTYAPNGQPNNPHFETYPGIFYLGNGNPSFTNSTIQ